MRFILSAMAGLLVACAGLEAVFHFLPVNSGVRMANTTPYSSYAHYLPEQTYLYSYGWAMSNVQRAATNKQGFSNSRDFQDGAMALVVGDSFIESFMNRYADTVQGQLDNQLGSVYAAAASGNGLADALHLSRHFLPVTHAKSVIIFIEPWDLRAIDQPAGRGHNSFVFDKHVVSVQHTPYIESSMKERVLKSSLLRYAYYNLKLPDWIKNPSGKPADSVTSDNRAMALHQRRRDLALDYFMSELQTLQNQYGTRFIFLLDSDRAALYSKGKTQPNWQGNDRAVLLAEAKKHGFAVVDMQPLFAEHWEKYRERLDFLPMDAHWNKVAHQLAADELAKVIKGGI